MWTLTEEPVRSVWEVPKTRSAKGVVKAFEAAGHSADLGHDGLVYLKSIDAIAVAMLLKLVRRA
ncbi:hypothetical protein ABIA10_001846 [Rhizobium leguminosarum]